MKYQTKMPFHKISSSESFRKLSDQILNLANQDIPRFEFLHKIVQSNVEDTRLLVHEYAIEKLGVAGRLTWPELLNSHRAIKSIC